MSVYIYIYIYMYACMYVVNMYISWCSRVERKIERRRGEGGDEENNEE